jgi:hypothetical protein
MATNLSKFTASELAEAAGRKLKRGRPSGATRSTLENTVRDRIASGTVKVAKGKLVRV